MATADTAAKPAMANDDTLAGFFYALTAYLLWGGLPIYLKMVAHIPPLEVVAHRALWSLPIAALVLIIGGRVREVAALLRQPKKIAMALITAGFVTINWLTYVYAIGSNHALESALGYYINPLISIIIAAIFLGEKIKGVQLVAVALAAIAVAILAWDAGGLPWISLVLAFSWGFYAFFKKSLPLGPNQGFFLEVLILSVPALGYLIFLESRGGGHFVHGSGMNDVWLLMFSGVATAAPLMIYANGAKLLRLSTIAIMQYIAPTIVFLMAVFLFHEPFGTTKLVAFGFIWAALIVYTASMFRGSRAK
ncbi:MAG: transporter superfamily protein [Rhizobium sp.]|nr:transporter superfamily protein [Rhizobium sp.]